MPSDQPGDTLATFAGLEDAAAATYAIRARVARIGQAPQNDVVLDDDTVSSNHARLEYTEGAWRITDLQSRNGTYLDGTRVEPGVAMPIADGTPVAFGAVKLRFQQAAGADPEAATEVPPTAGVPPRRRGLRLPVWLFLLILFVIAAILYWVANVMDVPPAGEPVPDVTPALIHHVDIPLAA